MKIIKPKSFQEHWNYQHTNPPAPFNPEFISWARDVSSIATANCMRNGIYEKYDRITIAAIRLKEYDRLMSLGKPSAFDVDSAKQYIYENS